MDQQLYVGVFFLVLAAIFARAARSDYIANQRQWSPVLKTRSRSTVIFAIVALGLILSWLLRG
jgi:hypothetical protein